MGGPSSRPDDCEDRRPNCRLADGPAKVRVRGGPLHFSGELIMDCLSSCLLPFIDLQGSPGQQGVSHTHTRALHTFHRARLLIMKLLSRNRTAERRTGSASTLRASTGEWLFALSCVCMNEGIARISTSCSNPLISILLIIFFPSSQSPALPVDSLTSSVWANRVALECLFRNGQFYFVGGSKNVHGVVRSGKHMQADIAAHKDSRYIFFREMFALFHKIYTKLKPLQRRCPSSSVSPRARDCPASFHVHPCFLCACACVRLPFRVRACM